MVKLDGKALGIVQLVNKGEGLEALRQLKLEYGGKSGNNKLRCCEEFSTQGQLGRLTQEMVARWQSREQVGKDHRPLSDSERNGHLRWYLGSYSVGTLA